MDNGFDCREGRHTHGVQLQIRGAGKGVERGHMMWLTHHLPRSLGKGVERGHMMWLTHLPWITTFNDTVEMT